MAEKSRLEYYPCFRFNHEGQVYTLVPSTENRNYFGHVRAFAKQGLALPTADIIVPATITAWQNLDEPSSYIQRLNLLQHTSNYS